LKKVRPVLKYLIFFAIGVLLLWLAFRNKDQEKILSAFQQANYWWLVISVLCMLISDVSRALRWTLLVRPLGYNLTHKHSFIAVMIGYLSNMIIPRMGELSRCVALNQTDDIPIDSLMGTVIVERVIDVFILITLVGVTLLIEYDALIYFYQYVLTPKLDFDLIPYMKMEGGLLVLSLLLLLGGVYYFLHRKYGWSVVSQTVNRYYKGFKSGLSTIRSLESPWKFWAHTVLIWGMYWVMTYVVFFSFEATSQLDPIAGLAIFVIGSVGFIMPVQGGIGTYHWAVTEGFKLYGVSASIGLTFATILHASQFLAILLVGGISYVLFLVIRYKKVRNKVDQPNAGDSEATDPSEASPIDPSRYNS